MLKVPHRSSLREMLCLLALALPGMAASAAAQSPSVGVTVRPKYEPRNVPQCSAGDPACPPPDVVIAPSGGTFTTASQSITIGFCGHTVLSNRQIVFNGVDVTSSFSWVSGAQAGCYQYKSSTGTVTFQAGFNSIAASATDILGQTGAANGSYNFAPMTPTLSLDPQATDRVDAGNCAASCFETTLGMSTPAYVSLGVPRSVSLLYRSGRARPMGKVELDATTSGVPAGTGISLQLMAANGSFVTFVNNATTAYFLSSSGTTTRLAAEFDASTIATGRYAYTATAQFVNSDGSPRGAATSISVGVIIVNDQNSPYGAGVDIVGLQRAFPTDNSNVLVTDGTGSASNFTYVGGYCGVSSFGAPCTYASPAGDYSTYVRFETYATRTYSDGTRVIYDANGYQIQVTDRFGVATNYAYVWNPDYGQYALSTITDPVGQVITFWYRDAGNLSGWKLNSLGNIDIGGGRGHPIGVSTTNDLLDWIDADWNPYAIATYDGLHRLTHVADRGGQGWDYAYDNGTTSHVASVTAPAVATIAGTQRPVVTFLEPSGAVLRYLENGGGTLANLVPSNPDTRARIVDPGGHASSFSANRWGQPLVTTDALGRTTTVTRDANGFVTQVQYPTGAVDQFRYAGQNLVMSRPAGGDSTNYHWSGTALLDSVWGAHQAFQKFAYTGNGAIYSSTTRYAQGDPTSFTTQYTTDAYGRPLTVTDPANHVTRFFYNGRYGNPDSVAMAAGQWTKTIYDINGRDSVQSALGAPASSTTVYDALNRVRSVNDGAHAQPFQYFYSAINLDSIADPMGQVFRRSVNALGWKTAEQDVDPSKGSISFNYDVEGEVRSWTNRRGQTINLTYDAAHRLTSRVGATMADYFGYSADDRRTAGWNAVSTDSVYYAANGWKDSAVTLIGGQRFRQQFLPDVGQRLDSVDIRMLGGAIAFAGRKYLYDAVKSTATSIRVNGVAGASFDYDGEMFLSGIRYMMPSQEATRQLYYTSTHQAYEDILDLSGFNPSSSSGRYAGYDSLGRIRESVTDGAYPYKTFKYSPSGQLTERAQYATKTTTFCPGPDANYGENCASQFNTAGTYEKDTYTFDDALNRRSDGNSGRTSSGSTWNSTTDIAYGTGDRIGAITPLGGSINGSIQLLPDPAAFATFERDLDGNVTRRYNNAGTDVRYAWDEQGRLSTVSVPATGRTATYDYNAFGQLVRRRTNGTIDRHFLWSGDDLLAELDGNATQRIGEYVYWSTDQPMAMVTGTNAIANIDYFLQDQLGNVRTAFRRASNAPIVFGADYSEWGQLGDTVAVASANRLRFKGMIWEGDSTQLYYARNRWYSPQFGGFMSEDPLGPAGGANTYAFAGNDPVNGSDPYGLFSAGGVLDFLQNGIQWRTEEKYLYYPPRSSGNRTSPSAPTEGPWMHEEGLHSGGFADPIGWLAGGIAGGVESGLAVLGEKAVVNAGSQVAANKIAGDAFRDEIAAAFENNGYEVAKEVGKKTPFGRRVIDVEVSRNGEVLGGIEAKAGRSRYLPWQMAKDEYLRRIGYPVQVVRDATAVKVSGISPP